MLISRKINQPVHPPLVFQGHTLQDVASHKHLGITFRSDLRWSTHIDDITSKADKLLNIMKSLKFRLDRQTLETIYISFIRPILEYGSPVWDGCTLNDVAKLEGVQLSAARIVTGAFAGTANAKLYEELGWETLANRREKAKLTLMYKIQNNLVPNTFQSIVTSEQVPHDCNTRRRYDLPHFRARTDLFINSFFPSTVRLWNELPFEIRNSESLAIFKSKLYKRFPQPRVNAKLYNSGNRFLSILHTRLRLGSSQLNSHLYKIGLKPTPNCRCGALYEDVWHYIFACPLYTAERSTLHSLISQYSSFSIQTVLYGSEKCTFQENILIFSAVQNYISQTSRFAAVGIG